MTTRVLILTRDVTREECPWLDSTLPAGKMLLEFRKPTYGCISYRGIAVCDNETGDYPFFEVPRDAVQEVTR